MRSTTYYLIIFYGVSKLGHDCVSTSLAFIASQIISIVLIYRIREYDINGKLLDIY